MHCAVGWRVCQAVIPSKSAQDPDAAFYGKLLHDSGATYIGQDEASSNPAF
jgi:hypothetical protein